MKTMAAEVLQQKTIHHHALKCVKWGLIADPRF
jgi:hypothetical protein